MNDTPAPGEPISLPEPSPIVGEAGRNSVRWGLGYTAAQVRNIVAADRAHGAASPDVTKMLEALKLARRTLSMMKPWDAYDAELLQKAVAAIDALGAAATQARAAVGTEHGRRLVRALVRAACLQEREPSEKNQNAYHSARETVEAALSAQTPGEGWTAKDSEK